MTAKQTRKNDGPAAPRLGDKKALAQLARVKKTVAKLSAEDSADRYDIGVALVPVRLGKLYTAKGYKTFQEYSEKELALDRTTAIALADEAAAYPRADFVAYGQNRARLGLMLLSATPEKDTVKDLAAMTLRFGPGKGKKFTEASVRELLADIAGERGKDAQQKENGLPAGARNIAAKLERAVKGDGIQVKPRWHATKSGGEIVCDVFGLPMGELTKVLAALLKAARA